jgi:hypothetical protein
VSAAGRRCAPAFALLLVSAPSWRAVADTGTPPVTKAAGAPSSLDQRLLRLEPAFWDTFGITLSRDRQRVGPTLFSVVPDEAVHGSPVAERHASHARVCQAFVIGFGVGALGLLGGGVAERASAKEWNDSAKLLVAGGVLSIVAQYVVALARQNEIAAAVSSYNLDLVQGRLSE